MSALGERLKTLRGAASQAQIARELGMKQPQYARYESGASSPSADVLIKMCEVFLCSADDILGTHRGGSDAGGDEAPLRFRHGAPGQLVLVQQALDTRAAVNVIASRLRWWN